MFLFSSRINRRKSFCFLSQNFTYLVLTRLAVNIPLAFTSANSSSRELCSFILPWHTKECCHLRKFIVTACRRVTASSLWTSIPNRAIFLSRKNPIGMLTWPHTHYMYPYQTTGTKRLLCSTACSISKVQISEVTEAGLKINKKVSAVASIQRQISANQSEVGGISCQSAQGNDHGWLVDRTGKVTGKVDVMSRIGDKYV